MLFIVIFVEFYPVDCEMRKEITEYRYDDRLRDAIDDNNLLLLVISRFRYPLVLRQHYKRGV